MPHLKAVLVALASIAALGPQASAQVAFVPNVSSFPSGVTLGVTPVVSFDRRYVRMTVNPQFTAIEGFDTIAVPGAVSGGPGGPAALGGLGGLGGGGGGFRNVGVPGLTFSAGMDGMLGSGSSGRGFGDPYSGYNSMASAMLSGQQFDTGPRFRPIPDNVPRPKATRRPAKRGKVTVKKPATGTRSR
jgi:hypothetical protein